MEKIQDLPDTVSSEPIGFVPDRAAFVHRTSPATESPATGPVMRSTNELRKHPVYAELQLEVSPAQFASIKHTGELAFKDPLLVTREGVIIDGYARKAYAEILGVSTLLCVELDISNEEALRIILNKHRRSAGWNDYNRIRMASRLKDTIRERARANQQAGGHLKGSSKLTEANVRREVAAAAGVSEGNVTKVHQLENSDLEVLKALERGEIRIHRAWLWRGLSSNQQREHLQLLRLQRSLKQPVKARALKHRVNDPGKEASKSLGVADLKWLLQQLLSIPFIGFECIATGVIESPGKAILLTTELYEDLTTKLRPTTK